MKRLLINKITSAVNEMFIRDRYVTRYSKSSYKNKSYTQLLVALSFMILSIANIIAKSYYMLILTVLGSIINVIFASLSIRYKNGKLSAYSSIALCSILFASFAIYGGNDGFACLWVVLLPLLSMIIMDFKFGLFTSIFFQIFLIVIFWTPINGILPYEYNEQFCLRFPLFFLVTFILGLMLTVSLRQSEYNECKNLIELQEMNKKALLLSQIDPLTKLANRRFAYCEFENKFAETGKPYCIVMGDIDNFKCLNDKYGHEFGDDVLQKISQLMTDILPESYLKSRWGGEEFLFAANASIADVYTAIERLRKTISAYTFHKDANKIHVTITFGIAEYTGGSDISEAIILADKRLYVGKSMKKNSTVIE